MNKSNVEVTTCLTESFFAQTIREDSSRIPIESSFSFRHFVTGIFGVSNEIKSELVIVTSFVVLVKFGSKSFSDHGLFEFSLFGFFFKSQGFLLFHKFVGFFVFGFFEHFSGSFENSFFSISLFIFNKQFSLGFFSLSFSHQHFFEADFFFLEDFSLFSQFSLLFFSF